MALQLIDRVFLIGAAIVRVKHVLDILSICSVSETTNNKLS